MAIKQNFEHGADAHSPGTHSYEGAKADGAAGTMAVQPPQTYAALDLGTNNCRLLVARPHAEGFRVIDAFSRIVRLGEGLSHSGRLSEAAIVRTLDALAMCGEKMEMRGVTRARLVATEACRMAANGQEFLDRVYERTGLELEIIDRETEAKLAVAGCSTLADPEAGSVIIFDIGGGSSEIIWLEKEPLSPANGRLRAWASLQMGVVSLAEKFGGMEVSPATYEAIVRHVTENMRDFIGATAELQRCARFHLLGTSGTVTTIAGIHLNLTRYARRQIDGLWMNNDEVDGAIERLKAMSYEERVNNACIGPDRADLVLAGCAIFEAIRRVFPASRTRIADRGLREGILTQMMRMDRVWDGSVFGRTYP